MCMMPNYRPGPGRARDGRGARLCAGLPATAAAAGPAAVASAACPGGLCLLDLDGPAVEARAVEAADGLLGFLRRGHLDEAEAPRPAGVPVGHDARGFDAAGRSEGLAQTLVRG